jgi:uncharacterized membrane protein SirB2
LSVAIQSRLWLTPLLQTIHILMIGVVFVSMLSVALRVLGQVRTDEPLAEVWHRFAPWFWTALGVMAGTGLILTISEPVREVSALSFWIKMTLIVIGVASALYFGRTVATAGVGAVTSVYSGRARVVAVATIVLWVAIMFLGRWIAYDVEIWESWHLA